MPPYPPPPPNYPPFIWTVALLIWNKHLMVTSWIVVVHVDARIVAACFFGGIVVLVAMALFHQRRIEGKLK